MTLKQSQMIENLYVEVYDHLLSFSLLELGSVAPAEEAVQETFRIACQKADSLQTCPNPRGWIFSTLKNTIRNTKHARATASRIFAKYLTLQNDEFTETEDFKLVKEYVIDKRSLYEMAQARGITVSACKKRLQRAKENLRRKLLE